VLGAHDTGKFSRRQHQIHITARAGRLHAGELALGFLCNAGHDRNTVNVFRFNAQVMSQPALCHRAEHLLRRQASGHFRVLAFEKTNPAGAARGEHRLVLEVSGIQTLEQLRPFLHDSEVGRERCIEHIIRSQTAQRRNELTDRGSAGRHAEGFTPCCTHCRSDLNDRHLALSAKSGIRFGGVIALTQSAGGAVGDALTAQRTVRLLDKAIFGNVNGRARAGTADVPDGERLHLIAYLNAAHALNALVDVAIERERCRPEALFAGREIALVRNGQHAEIIRDLLKLARTGTDTGRALIVVLRQNQLNIGAARLAHARRIGMDHHSFLHDIVARGDELALALDLNAAHAAGGDFIDVLEIAQARNFNADRGRRFQNGRAFGYGYRDLVYCQVYHLLVRPPLKIP